jgi:hypothetical protein
VPVGAAGLSLELSSAPADRDESPPPEGVPPPPSPADENRIATLERQVSKITELVLTTSLPAYQQVQELQKQLSPRSERQHQQLEMTSDLTAEEDEEMEDAAAVMIQSQYRGYRDRML